MADLITSVYGALDKLDCAINAYGCVMMELDDDPERDDKREVDTIKWLYEVLRDEAHNVRGYLTSRRLRHREPGLIKTAPDASRKPNGKTSPRAVCDCSRNR